MSKSSNLKKHRVTGIIAMSAAGLAILIGLYRLDRFGQLPRNPGIDFVQFDMVARHVAADGDPRVYSKEIRELILANAWDEVLGLPDTDPHRLATYFRHKRSLETYSSPLLYSAFTVGLEWNYASRVRVFRLLCTLTLVAGLCCFGVVLNCLRASLVLSAVAVNFYGPLYTDIAVANVNQLTVGFMGVALWLASRSFAFGASFLTALWATASLLFKPVLLWSFVLLAVYRISKTGKTEIVAWGIGILIAASATLVACGTAFPLQSWLEWIAAVSALPSSVIPTSHGNVSILPSAPSIAGLLLGGTLCAMFVGVATCGAGGNATGDDDSNLGERKKEAMAICLAAGVLIFQLTSRLCWYHYLVFTLPAILILIRISSQSGVNVERITGWACTGWLLAAYGLRPLDEIWKPDKHEDIYRTASASVVILLVLSLQLRAAISSHGNDKQEDDK